MLCVRARNILETLYNASDQVTVLIICLLYTFPPKKFHFQSYYTGTFDVPCGMLSNIISLLLRDGDLNSENVSLIQLSVSGGQRTCSSKGVLLIDI